MNIIQTLRHRAELQPGVPAIVDRTFFGDRVLTYAALNRSVDFLALRLDEEGIKRGDQVLMLLDPSQELYLFLLALLQIGAVPTLADALTGLKPFGQWVEQCRPAACVLPQSNWLSQRFHRQLRLIPKKLFPHAFRFENRILRIGKFGTPVELAKTDLALIELRRGGFGGLEARGWTQPQLARTVQRLVSHLKMKAGEIDLCDWPLLLLANANAGVTSVVPVRPGLLSHRSHSQQVEKFQPARVTAPAAFLLHYLRKSSSPLHKIIVMDAPLPPESLEFFVRCQQFANVELLFGQDVPLASCSLNEYQSVGTPRWVGQFFADVKIRVEPEFADTNGHAEKIKAKVPQVYSGELLVAGDFLPRPLDLNGEVDTSRLAQFENGEQWIKTGLQGSLDKELKFQLSGE
ncbi:MAG: AMP-binding protein [Verrucomicrobia bacterium]|nr:AMP-binding protein [Verrucomicrobiota bacterium]